MAQIQTEFNPIRTWSKRMIAIARSIIDTPIDNFIYIGTFGDKVILGKTTIGDYGYIIEIDYDKAKIVSENGEKEIVPLYDEDFMRGFVDTKYGRLYATFLVTKLRRLRDYYYEA